MPNRQSVFLVKATFMRITFVTPFPALSGGIRVVASYARQLHDRGHEVHVVAAPEARRYSLKRRLRFALRLETRPPPRPRTPLLDFLGPRLVTLTSPDGPRPDEVPDADVVVATWWQTAEWVAGLPDTKGGKAYLIQGYEVPQDSRRDRVAATFTAPLKKIAVSNYIRSEIKANHAVAGDIAVVPNAVDTLHFTVPPRARNATLRVGLLYSTAPGKNIGLAFTALELARAHRPGLQALAFGRASIRPDLPLPDWVEYTRAPPQAEIPKLYAACDLWLFPTEKEGFGLPLLEAMACRTPVAATAAGAAPDLINGRNGLILPPDPEAFTEMIVRFADMPDAEWQRWSQAAFETAQRHNWAAATDRLLLELEALVRQPAAS